MTWPEAFAIVGMMAGFVAFVWIAVRAEMGESETSKIMRHYREQDHATWKRKDTTK